MFAIYDLDLKHLILFGLSLDEAQSLTAFYRNEGLRVVIVHDGFRGEKTPIVYENPLIAAAAASE